MERKFEVNIQSKNKLLKTDDKTKKHYMSLVPKLFFDFIFKYLLKLKTYCFKYLDIKILAFILDFNDIRNDIRFQ